MNLFTDQTADAEAREQYARLCPERRREIDAVLRATAGRPAHAGDRTRIECAAALFPQGDATRQALLDLARKTTR